MDENLQDIKIEPTVKPDDEVNEEISEEEAELLARAYAYILSDNFGIKSDPEQE